MAIKKKAIYYDHKKNIEYFEYKYHIPHHQLPLILSILDSWCAQSDKYPKGWVDSIYYDNYNSELLEQCTEGYNHKTKFRIRGYNDHYLQAQQKIKNIYGVIKYKSNIELVKIDENTSPNWESLTPLQKNNPDFMMIKTHSQKFGPLVPTIRIKYFRYRYRLYDYRITVDTRIEFFSPNHGIAKRKKHAFLPFHVLEVKTRQLRPSLPFMGIISLNPVSCSKFMLGLNILE